MLSSLVEGLVSPITKIVTNWQDQKRLDVETKNKIAHSRAINTMDIEKASAQAKITEMSRLAESDKSYDTLAMKNMNSTWKDEFLILLHTFPIWGYGLPSSELHKGLDRIWEMLGSAPYWWWLVYMGMVASTFGLRWLFSKQRVDTILKGR